MAEIIASNDMHDLMMGLSLVLRKITGAPKFLSHPRFIMHAEIIQSLKAQFPSVDSRKAVRVDVIGFKFLERGSKLFRSLVEVDHIDEIDFFDIMIIRFIVYLFEMLLQVL